MPQTRNKGALKLSSGAMLCLLLWIFTIEVSASESSPPQRCTGYGNLQSISLTDWETGLGAWSVGTRGVLNPSTFDTPDWAVAGTLPDSRSGKAAFVPNLNIGDCGNDDETGVLYLESPPIVIPGGTQVPRISFDHWFDIEFGWDGGNLGISVNGGAFNLVPASAIEYAPYNDTLFPALDEFGFVNNTNPLADQEAYTGRFDGQPTGSWVQSRINLLGIAGAGDTIELRFEFGIDCRGGSIGWYVDDVEFYSCEAELLPSDCGNGVIDTLEQCDDGNDFIGDGCSNTCQVEDGWQCAAPSPPGTIADPSFEDGWPNQFWTETSNNSRNSPICDAATCNTGGGSGPSDGAFWVWMGGALSFREASVSQSIVIPSTVSQLTFDLEIPVCDSATDFFEVLVDGNQLLRVDGSDPRCGTIGYTSQSVDISAYADDLSHDLEIHGITVAENGFVSNFFIDLVELPGSPSVCSRIGTSLTLSKNVVNDDGGSAFASAWTLSATGPSSFSGPGPEVSSGPGFLPGSYVLSESGPTGYGASAWTCDGGNLTGNTITLALDEDVSCTITNDDIPPTLTVTKTIVNDNGGSVTNPDAFGLKIDGIAVLHNEINIVDFGDHVVSENGLPGYTPGTWGGDCNTDGSISLALAQNATCTITNDDIAPRLTVVKTIMNNNGGSITDPNLFGLRIDGVPVGNNIPTLVNAGARIVSEDGLAGYQPGPWGGDCDANGSITLALDQEATCTITNDDIEPTLTLVKHLPNDNGGTATADQFQAYIDGNPVAWNTPITLDAGVHTATEDGLPGYQASAWFNACAPDGSVTLNPGDQLTCEITNDDIGPTLTLVKHLPNDNGGTATANQFQAYIDGNPVAWNTPIALAAGTHTASEDNLPGYQASAWFNACAPNGSVTLNPGDQLTCEITNDDIGPTLTLVKHLPNDNGGTAIAEQFQAYVDGNPVAWNTPIPLVAGVHTATEDSLPGYQASGWFNACAGNGSVMLNPGDQLTCEITNDDVAPSLTLVIDVINDNGGTVLPTAWTLTATGPTGFSGSGPSVSNGTGFEAGTYDLSQSPMVGYSASDWVCVGGTQDDGNTVTLATGESSTCTITTDDISPTIKVIKSIVNNNGGTVTDPDAFGLRVDDTTVLHDVTTPFDAGNHTLSEVGLPGYVPTTWSGGCNADGTIDLQLAQSVTCFITNDDTDSTSLTLVKQVVNNNGGTAQGSDWTLTATGPTGFSGQGPVVSNELNFSAGTYDLSELGPAGYTPSNWVCVGGTQVDSDTVTLALGEAATCTITNDDETVGLSLNKIVTNDNGGTAVAADWTLNAVGPTPLSGPGPTVSSGANFKAGTYTLSESAGPGGYTASAWVCDGGSLAGNALTLALGESANCTITNDDQLPSLTLNKVVINNNGGVAAPSNWTLNAAGPTPLNGAGPTVSSGAGFKAGTYILSESAGPGGYLASAWVCDGGSLDGNSLTLAPGESANCTITNDDAPVDLTLNKVVINNNGGIAIPANWTLDAAGPTPFSGQGPSVSSPGNFEAGSYVLSETGGPAGYSASAWNCEGGSLEGDTLTLALGESASCTISNDDQPPSLSLNKVVTNDNGGTAAPADWTLNAAGPMVLSGPGPIVSSGADFPAGSYILSENGGQPGYSASAWNCNGGTLVGNTLTLAIGQSASCTITNDDMAPSLTLDKIVVNNNGGVAAESDWTLFANDGPTPISGPGAAGSIDVQSGANFKAGTYNLSESTGPNGYTAGAWSCVGGSQNGNAITVGLGESANCTITNDDGVVSLTLNKVVTNDNGGTADPADWTLSAAGPTPISGQGPSVTSPGNFEAGSYVLSESPGPDGYTASAWVCDGGSQDGNTLTLALGDSVSCTITNNDQAPSLTLNKVVTNDNGGTADPADWTLNAAGPTPLTGPGPTVSSDAAFKAGSYVLSESTGPSGYAALGWNCDGGSQDGNTVVLALGESANCTITNDDQVPSLVLDKIVINNNGGTASESDWTLSATDGPTPISGPGAAGSTDVQSGAGFEIGTYNLSESTGPAGYTASSWSCVGGSLNGSAITVNLGESANCTITNDDDPVSLTLNKVVTNDNGGTAVAADWTLSAAGPTPLSGQGPSVSSPENFEAGSYVLSESAGPDGYAASAWICDGGSLDGDTLTLAPGDSADCSITNDDQAPSLTLNKAVINDNGGTAVPADWTLNAAGPTPLAGAGPAVSSGTDFKAGSYVLSESTGPEGYTASDWICDGGSLDADTLTLALGESASCTITNDDDGPGLTLNKAVTNDNGGTAVPADWTLSATGPTPFSGPGPSVSSPENFQAGSYVLSESAGPNGYTASAWECDGGDLDGDTLTLAPGESVSCTITNDDDTVSLTLNKEVIKDNGGIALPSDWTLNADGPTPFSGPGPSVSSPGDFEAGSYVLSESAGPEGYTASDWVCDGGSLEADTLTLALGESVTCTVTNDDDAVSLTLIKEVINDNEGTAAPADWTLTATGPTPFSGPGPTVSSPENFEAGSYMLSESIGPEGYTANPWVCDGGDLDGDTLILVLGESVTCTITNEDDGISEQIFKDGFE